MGKQHCAERPARARCLRTDAAAEARLELLLHVAALRVALTVRDLSGSRRSARPSITQPLDQSGLRLLLGAHLALQASASVRAYAGLRAVAMDEYRHSPRMEKEHCGCRTGRFAPLTSWALSWPGSS